MFSIFRRISIFETQSFVSSVISVELDFNKVKFYIGVQEAVSLEVRSIFVHVEDFMISYFFIGVHKTHPPQGTNHSFVVKILVKLDRPLGLSHSQVVVTSCICTCLLQSQRDILTSMNFVLSGTILR